jgi:hypothetical protein
MRRRQRHPGKFGGWVGYADPYTVSSRTVGPEVVSGEEEHAVHLAEPTWVSRFSGPGSAGQFDQKFEVVIVSGFHFAF